MLNPRIPTDRLKPTVKPSIKGKHVVGKKLTARQGTWTPSATNYRYQWKRNGTAIEGATGKTYKIKKGDLGKKITVKVKAANPAYETGVATTKPVTVQN